MTTKEQQQSRYTKIEEVVSLSDTTKTGVTEVTGQSVQQD